MKEAHVSQDLNRKLSFFDNKIIVCDVVMCIIELSEWVTRTGTGPKNVKKVFLPINRKQINISSIYDGHNL